MASGSTVVIVSNPSSAVEIGPSTVDPSERITAAPQDFGCARTHIP